MQTRINSYSGTHLIVVPGAYVKVARGAQEVQTGLEAPLGEGNVLALELLVLALHVLDGGDPLPGTNQPLDHRDGTPSLVVEDHGGRLPGDRPLPDRVRGNGHTVFWTGQ